MQKEYTIAYRLWHFATVAVLALLSLLPMEALSQTFTIGANNGVNTPTGYPAPYGQWWTRQRAQYLYTAAELTAAGMMPGHILTSVGFNVTVTNGAAPHSDYKMWIGNTAVTTLTAWVPAASLTQVYGPNTQTPVVGTNTFTFTGPFVWNGTSNIVVQIWHGEATNSTYTSNASTEWTTLLAFNGARHSISDTNTEAAMMDDASGGTNLTTRPRVVFTGFPPTPCAGAMSGGTTNATPSNYCASGSTSLTIIGGTGLATGLSYQWQSSTDGINWTDIVGATASSATSPTVSVTTQFRRRITCANGGSVGFSTPVIFANVLGTVPFAQLPYIQDFETWIDKCSTREIPRDDKLAPLDTAYWVNTPSTGNLSWRRQNDGASANWTNPNNNTGLSNVTPISGTGAACFHAGGFPTTGNVAGQQGWMDLYVNMGSTFKKEVRFLYRNRQQFVYTAPALNANPEWLPVHADQMEVLLSTDGGLTFPTTLGIFGSETLDSIPATINPPAGSQSINVPTRWKKIAIKVGNVAPNAIIRFRATTATLLPLFAGGTNTDIAIDDVQVVELRPCTGTPIAGTLNARPAKLCDPGVSYLSVTGSEDLLGGQDLTFVWETSADGITWNVITAADQPDYTTPVLTTQPFYRRKITCKNSTQSAYTNTIQILQVRPTYAVVTPGWTTGRYIQLFDSWIDGCQAKQLPDVSWKNTPNIGNRSWRNRADVLPTSTPANVGNWLLNGLTAPTTSLALSATTGLVIGGGAATFYSRGAVGKGDLDLYVDLSASTNRKAVQFWYSNTSGTDNMTVLLSQNGGTTYGAPLASYLQPAPNPAWGKKGAFIVSNSPTNVIRFSAQSGGPPLEGTDIGIDSLVVIDLVPCTLMPRPGTAAAGPASFCLATDITISVTGGSDDASVAIDDRHTFQWQICTTGNCGPASVDWTNILGQTGGSLQLSLTPQPNGIPGAIVPRQYRRAIICPTGTLTAYSNAVTLEFPYPIGLAPAYDYATIPFYEPFERGAPNVDVWLSTNVASGCAGSTFYRPSPFWRNTPSTGSNSWRSIGTTGNPSSGGWTTTGIWGTQGRIVPIGTGAASFNTFGARDSNEGKLDLYFNASGTQMKQVRFRYYNPNAPAPKDLFNDDQMEFGLSQNNGQSFSTLATLGRSPGWVPYFFNFNNDSPQAAIRFNGKRIFTVDFNNNPEGTDIGVDELYIVYVNDCAAAGALVGGTASRAAAFCNNPPYTLFVLGSSSDTHYGFEFQWQVSENGGPFADIPGATDANYFMTGARQGDFRRIIKCTATTTTALSTVISTAFNYPLTYATLPYSQNFETWINGCAIKDLPDASWKNTPFTGSKSWRRQNEGLTANWIYNYPEPLPNPVSGTGCATFHTFFQTLGFPGGPTADPQPGLLDLYVNASAVGTKQLRFLYTNPNIEPSIANNGNKDSLEIFISINGGETFTKLAGLTKQDGWAEYIFKFQSTSGATVIRFQGNGILDDSDIGVDDVQVAVLAPCAAAPVGGTAKPSTSSGNACTILSLLLFVENSATNSQEGFTYQWQASLDAGATWVNVPNATNNSYEAAPLVTTHYRRIITCTASTQQGTSAPYIFYISASPEYAVLPYTEDFERWGDGCDDKDVPFPVSNKYHWRSRPFTGNNAWRKTGQEQNGGWGDRTTQGWLQGGRVIPATGTGAASFHSYTAANRSTGDLELYLNTINSAAGDAVKVLQFDYSNSDYPTAVPGFTNDDQLEVFLSLDGGFTFSALPIATYTRTKDLWETKRIVFDNVSQPYLDAQYVVMRFRATSDNGGTDIGIDNLSIQELPKKDAGVTAIEFNRCSPIYGSVVVEVTNFGSETIQNFPVQYTIGANTYTENFPLRLEIFQKAKYQFTTPTNVAGVSSLTITAKSNLVGDLNATNDSKTVTLPISNFAGVPYTEDFVSGIPANWSVQAKLNTPGWFAAVKNDGLPLNTPALPNEFPFNLLQMTAVGAGFDGGFVALDDNKGGAARTNDQDRLITPAFDLSNYSNAAISFTAYHSNIFSNGRGKFTLESSLNDGSTWEVIPSGNIIGDVNSGVPTQAININLPANLQGRSNVRLAFRYNDDGVIAGGVAIDNFQLLATAVTIPLAKVSTPTINRAFVNRGTEGHVVYRFNVEANVGNAVLSDVILKTGSQEYKVEDFKLNSFNLFVSTDSTLSAVDQRIGRISVVPKGQNAVFSCLNYSIPKDQTRYFFFTVDVANAPTATLRDSINVQLPTISSDNGDNFITIFGNRVGLNLRAGGYQIIADQNNPPTAEDIVLEMKQKAVQSDPNLVFKAADFKFADLDTPTSGDIFRKLQITTKNLPNADTKLQLNGVDVVSNQIISVTQIPQLVFSPRINDAGLGYATITFKVYDGRDWSARDYTVRINVLSDKIYMPTLFSPNADGANDNFIIRGGEGNIEKLTLRVLDRNNNPMYESSDIIEITTKGWNGKKDGKEQPAGAYLWYIEGTYKNGKPIEFNGKKTGVIRMVR